MEKLPLDDFLEWIEKTHGEENWVTVYKHIEGPDGSADGGFYSALVSQEKTEKAMTDPSWDLRLGSGGPGFSVCWEDGVKKEEYHQHSHDGLRPLVIYRDFYGRKESYIEVLEEFRLLHNLYCDTKTGTYYAFDEAGDEVEVIKLTQDEVKIRRSYLRGFMAATQLNLLLYFEYTGHFKSDVHISDNIESSTMCVTRYSGESYSDGYKSCVRILGKKLIRCDAMQNCGIWPFERKKTYQEFIIGGDVDNPVVHTCDPDRLADYFGANPGAPHYLKPVFFKKEVMQKYYASSDYEITDGRLIRHGAWSLRFDNNSSDHVSVFLGDLGRDLPAKEQTYWKSYNIFPDGRKISRTNFERSFNGNFFDPENPEHKFKHSFDQIQRTWIEKLGWPLFLPLCDRDKHFLSSIRSMLTTEQSEFDAQILAVSKVTIDSVNIRALRDYLSDNNSDSKSIALLEQLFEKLALDAAQWGTFLRGVQSVRSTGVAHRKGTEYEKLMAKLNFDEDNYRLEFDAILRKFATLFDMLLHAISSNSNSAPAGP
ncbi:hypothetical protein [Burkholderia pseudomallei]|uniref:hypothetical protein n=1 Tax=Burkholderia pseudomallei TaxID=28450 RepID=UPI000A1A0382|nr:hypothetical protein [Burkholderia pseudomallei]ARL35316.1 hypothetical protein BOC49_02790 [Burkholderia pseudomallei]